MRVFISQPMNGKSAEQILKEREKAIAMLQKKFKDFEIVDNYFADYFADFEESKYKIVPLAYLAKSIELLATADLAVFCEGYDKARGCQIENLCAKQYGLFCMYL